MAVPAPRVSNRRADIVLVLDKSHSGAFSLNIDERELGEFLVEPLISDTQNPPTVLSTRSQIKLVLDLPRFILTDESGRKPVRHEFMRGIAGFISMLESKDIALGSYGWNLGGEVRRARVRSASQRLLAEEPVAHVVGIGPNDPWAATRVQLQAQREDARVGITLSMDPTSGDAGSLRFSVNFHREASPDTTSLRDEGRRYWDETVDIVTRFLEGSG